MDLPQEELLEREGGNAIIEFLLVLPVMVTLLYSSIRYSVLISAVPVVQHNLVALLNTFEESPYVYSFDNLNFDPAAVQRNVARISRTVDPVPGTKQASAMLGLETVQHGVVVAAYRCDCGGVCSQLIASQDYTSGVSPDIAGDQAAIQNSCTSYFRTTAANQNSSVNSDCIRFPNLPSVCYGAVAEFKTILLSRTLGSVRFEIPKDSMSDPGVGAGLWRAGAQLTP